MQSDRRIYFIPLARLPVIVDKPGNYKTRSGETIIISEVLPPTTDIATPLKNWVGYGYEFGCAGNYSNGIAERWHRSGRIFAGRETANDILGRC